MAEDFLTEGEKVYKKMRTSRRSISVMKYYVLAIILLAIGISLFLGLVSLPEIVVGGVDIVYSSSLVLLALSGILFLYAETERRRRGEYIITNYRILVKKGFLRTQVDSVTNKMIINVRAIQGTWQKLLSIGNVDVTTSAGGKEIELVDINNFREIENLIYKLMESREHISSSETPRSQ